MLEYRFAILCDLVPLLKIKNVFSYFEHIYIKKWYHASGVYKWVKIF